jgi:hypothetical protein
MKKSILLIIFLSMFFHSPCLARGDVSVTLKLDRPEATLLDSITLVVSVSGTRKSDAKPALKGLHDFEVRAGGTSSRIEIINGKVNAGVDYTYTLQPRKAGNFTIGPAEVTVKGKTIKSNTETLRIVKAIQSGEVDRGPLFLSATLSPKQVFVEEQALYTLKLFRQNRVGDISLGLPEAEHLTFKQLGKPIEYQSVYKGQSYQVLEVRYALISSKEGIYGIRPSRMSMTVFRSRRKSPRSLFDDPFFSFSSGQPVTIASEPLELNVLPLPQKGRPTDFSGLVGSFKVKAHLEPSKIRAGESATLTVLLSGRGNVKRIPDLKLPELEKIKVYADQPVLMEETDARGLAGSKTMKWALVPEKEGEYRIPSLSISFFDIENKQYRVLKSPALSMSVLPVENAQTQISQDVLKGQKSEGPRKQVVKELGQDILPVHTSIKDLHPGARLGIGGMVFWAILIIPFFAYAGTFFIQKFHRKTTVSVAAARARKAAKILIQECHKGALSSNHLTSAIRRYLNERFNLSLGSLTPDEAADILGSRGVSVKTSEKLRRTLQELEDTIYTGKGKDPCHMGGDIPELIKQIEKEIR